jgi:hypothetical protein
LASDTVLSLLFQSGTLRFLSGLGDGQVIEWIGYASEMSPRQMQVLDRVFELGVPQQLL